ncbi:cyclic nucleotide-gated ion channel 1 [Citrus sinensis]|uniref:Cyclic nucleotide-gated ion channel 1 n=1 Tax=Citrus sinensis TaxID=2711 RepID=A0ACB8HR76_CITSI|nr:cyclic nucleotide-gated ion channel 1 [Citrus sinensis]
MLEDGIESAEGLLALICCKKSEGSFYHFESCLRTRTGKGTSGKLKHRKGSVSGKFQRDPYFGLEIDESSGLTESTTSMPDMLTLLRQWPYFDWMKIIFSVIEIQVEALYFYAPVINDERKCFDMHQQFLENAFVLGFFLICIHMVIFLSYKNPLGFVINFLIYYSILAAVRSSTELSEAKWVKIAVNLYLYLQAANVFGGLWYFMAIERVIECWTKACINHTGQHCHFSCRVNLEEDRTYINGFCPTKIRNTTIHDFGIFRGALESGIVEGTSILQKLLHCFVWGLQNLSNLGHDLQSGSDVWENIFVILVVSSGFLFFALLIGNMQIYLQSRTVRLKEMTVKPQEIEEWKPFQNLSANLQQEMKKYKPYIRRKTNHIDIENLLNNIPKELGKKIKRELCWHLLKKVHEFRMLKEETLDALCDCVKPTFFTEHAHIIREGDPIDELIFVMQGNLWTYSFNDLTNGSTRKRDHLEDSDFYGAELVDWALRDCSSFEFSKSTKTIEALTNIEAFTLMADDLKIVKFVFPKRRPPPLPVRLRYKVKEKTPVPQRSKVKEKTPLPQQDKVKEMTPVPQRSKVKVKMRVPQQSKVKEKTPVPQQSKVKEKTPLPHRKVNKRTLLPRRSSVKIKIIANLLRSVAKVFTRDSSSALKIYEPSGSSISGKSQRDSSSALEIYELSGSSISGKSQRDSSSALEIDEPSGSSIFGKSQRDPSSALEIYEPSGSSFSGKSQRDPSSALEIDEPSGSSISGKSQRDSSSALEIDEPSGSSISGKSQRDPSSALEIYEPSGSSISGKSQRDPSSALEIYEPSGSSFSGKSQRDPSSALEIDEPSGSSISGKSQRDPSSALKIYEPSGSSISGKSKRDPSSALEIYEPSGFTELTTSNVKRLLYKMKNIFLRWPYFDWMQMILVVTVISVDPLFFYLPVINNLKKCLDLHYQLLDIVNVLSSVLLVIHVLIIVCVPFASYLMHIGENSHKNQWCFIIFDFLIFLPITQMAGTLLIETMGGPKFVDSVRSFKHVVFIQYVARIIRIYALFSTAIRSLRKHATATWARFAFNLFVYLQAANVFGGLWYFMAIERQTECWTKACINYTGRSHCSFNCHDNLEDYTFLNEFCPMKTRNVTIHDFGIFHGALESGILEGKNFLQKILHCFIWGLQNLSNLSHNLQTSGNVEENIFVILVVSSGFLLFALLIGNMQRYLKLGLKEMTLKPREIEEWQPFQKLSKNLQQKVKKYKSYIRRKTDYIDVQNLLNNLPNELRRELKRELCWNLLKKVQEFRKLNEVTLDALCDCVKPTFFTEHTHLIREGDPIDEMIFLVQGKLRTYTFKDIQSGSTSSDHKRYDGKNTRKEDLLQDGDFYGEELIDWALRDRFSFDIPKSNRTIQALTNVDAFMLMADDLKIVVNDMMNQLGLYD